MKDIYVDFNGGDIKGETEDAKHKAANCIEVSAFTHKITQPKSSTASNAGGHSAERTEHGEMIFTKDIDKASAKLWQACSAGTVYPKVTVYFYRAVGGSNSTTTGAAANARTNYLKIELRNVLVSSVNTNISSDTELPTETFGLKYSAVKWTYAKSQISGTAAATMDAEGAWDLAKNVAFF
jgi:type VI secretion system secreted protein Hcp